MQNIKVSVILPFHNGQDYIDETMECLLNQTLKEIEIICVDDASTDDTVLCLKKYAEKDSRIRVIEQEKANAGVARNLGKTLATGRYLLFLDSDDLFEKDMLECMYQSCEEYDSDLCVCNADQFDNEKKIYIEKQQYLREKLIPQEIPFSREAIGKYILYFTTSVPWNKMVKRSFLDENNIQFQDIERANDQYFSIMVLLLAQRISIVRKKLVHYRVKQKENLTTKFSETPLCAYEAMRAVQMKLEELQLLDIKEIRCAFDNKIINLMLYSLNIQCSVEGYKKLYDSLHRYGFHDLGLELQEESYYFNRNEYKNLRLILQDSYEEYLLKKNKEYRDTINNKKIANKELKKKNIELKKELDNKQKELTSLQNSKAYKIAKKMTLIYRKICRK